MTDRTLRLGELAARFILGVALSASLAGCGGGKLGSELSLRPTPQALGGGAVLHLPADQTFSIALAPTEEAPELDGTAEADAQASKDGSAHATASVNTAGKATAGFQLGHAVKNDSDRQVALHVRVRCAHETSVESSPPGPSPDAKAALYLYARDQHNRLLRSISLAEDASDDGAATSKDTTDVTFELLLGPHDSANIFLAGTVQIDTRRGRSASGGMKLSGLQMDIETKAAPPVTMARDEQG